MKTESKAILTSFMILYIVLPLFIPSWAQTGIEDAQFERSQRGPATVGDSVFQPWMSDRFSGIREVGQAQDFAGLKMFAKRGEQFLEYDFSIGSFKIVKVKLAGSEWDLILCNDTVDFNTYGMPSIPYKKILVPLRDAVVLSIAINRSLAEEISGVRVLPALKPLPVDSKYLNWSNPSAYIEENFYADSAVYSITQEFPSEVVQTEIVSFRGNRFLSLVVFPMTFHPLNGTLAMFNVKVRIELSKTVADFDQSLTGLTPEQDAGYVIIVPSAFSDAVGYFAEWKRQLGFTVETVTLEDIYTRFDGRDQPEQVRNFIVNSYTINGTQYFLLVGDCDVCPVREVWDPAYVRIGLDNGTEPCDMYYECLDGDWDANGNGMFGEPSDDVDLYPEVKVGRIPVNTTKDVQSVLTMIRKLEEDPQNGEWIKNFLLIAPDGFAPGDCSGALDEEIYQKFLADSFFNTTRLYSSDRSLSEAAVFSALNSGVNLVDFFDHGQYDRWANALETSDVLNLYNGNKIFLAFAMACETAAFDYQDDITISEAFFRNPMGGAAGYIGATRIAWAGYDCFDGVHNRFWNYFLESTLKSLEANPKTALQDALVEMVSTYNVEGPTRETIYQTIYFGDPALNMCWKQNVTVIAAPCLETNEDTNINVTCSLLHSGKATEGSYHVKVADPLGKVVAEDSGQLGIHGDFAVNFRTTEIPGNYAVETTLTEPFSYTHQFTFQVGTLHVSLRQDSEPIYASPLQVSGQVLENENLLTAEVNISIVSRGHIVNSEALPLDVSGQFRGEINLTTFGIQELHVCVSNGKSHGGNSTSFKVKRGEILVVAYDSIGLAHLYPGGWYSTNYGSSTSYYYFYHALTGEYDVSIYRTIYENVPSLAFLQQFSAVIVTCGDNFAECLTNPYRNMTQVLLDYHNSKGRLIFEGADVAFSLSVRGCDFFMESVLHAKFVSDLTNMALRLDNNVHAITQGLPSQIELAAGLGSPNVDLVSTANGSETVSGYVGHPGSSILAFPGDPESGPVVYFSFSVDGINEADMQALLIRNSVDYLLFPTLSVTLSDYAVLANTSETIEVQVKDSCTRQPIEAATVIVDGCGISTQNVTDRYGVCDVQIAPATSGNVTVTAMKQGYPALTAPVIVYEIPKLQAEANPSDIKKKAQIVSVKVTDFFEFNNVDDVNVTLSGCGISATAYTNSTGMIEFTVAPTSFGNMQLAATKDGYENYTGQIEVYLNAVVVDSFDTDYPFLSYWSELNQKWQQYGTTPVRVDVKSLDKLGITYQDLVKSEADVLIIACPAAVDREYTDEEISAIELYTLEGHGLIATAGTFYEHYPNNNKLAPLFGIRKDIYFTTTRWQEATMNILDMQHPLFKNIPTPYTVGDALTACPPDHAWDQNDLSDGTYLAISGRGESVVVVRRGAVYISYAIDFNPSQYDFQLMYNALAWSRYEVPEHDLRIVLSTSANVLLGKSTLINVTILNIGISKEFDVQSDILINGSTCFSNTISLFENDSAISLSYTWMPTKRGSYNVTAYVHPVLGENLTVNNVQSETVFVEGDDSPPVVSITSPQNECVTNQKSIQIYWIGYDDQSGIAYYVVQLNGELVGNLSGATTHCAVSNIVEGSNIISVTAYDRTGFCTSSEITIVADFTLPTAQIIMPSDRDHLHGTTTMIFTGCDSLFDRMELYIRDGCVAVYESNGTVFYSWNTTLIADGDCRVQLTVYDKAGNSVSTDVLVTIDNSPPQVEWQSPITGSCVSGAVTLNFSCSDPHLVNAKIMCDGEPLADVTGEFYYCLNTFQIVDGMHIFVLTAADEAGNINISQPIALTIDNTLPFVEILKLEDTEIVGGTCNVSFAYDDANLREVSLKIDDVTYDVVGITEFSFNTTQTSDGNHTLTLTVVDMAGNMASKTIRFVVDNSPPRVELTDFAELSAAKLVGIVDLNFTCSDENLEKVMILINGTIIDVTGSNSYQWNTSLLGDGTYEIILTACDRAGNVAETPSLHLTTANVQKLGQESYAQGEDFGLKLGIIVGIAISSLVASTIYFALRKRVATKTKGRQTH